MSENMKPSGVNYLGAIPSSWNAKRMKYCADICNGAEYADIVIDEGGFPVMGSGGEFARASKFCYSNQSVLLGRKGTIDSAIKNIPPFSVLKKENIPLPKFLEQIQIANYLDQQCSKIDSIIESKKEQLTKITQHKKSLIYEYVTGKKRIKGAKDNGN